MQVMVESKQKGGEPTIGRERRFFKGQESPASGSCSLCEQDSPERRIPSVWFSMLCIAWMTTIAFYCNSRPVPTESSLSLACRLEVSGVGGNVANAISKTFDPRRMTCTHTRTCTTHARTTHAHMHRTNPHAHTHACTHARITHASWPPAPHPQTLSNLNLHSTPTHTHAHTCIHTTHASASTNRHTSKQPNSTPHFTHLRKKTQKTRPFVCKGTTNYSS